MIRVYYANLILGVIIYGAIYVRELVLKVNRQSISLWESALATNEVAVPGLSWLLAGTKSPTVSLFYNCLVMVTLCN